MKQDIHSRSDLETVLADFYRRVIPDPGIGHFFNEVVRLDLPAHLPLITDFWESVVLGSQAYGKNVMAVHQHLHTLSPIGKAHLDRWVELFTNTVDAHFAGDRAELMKQRARSVATLMDIKLNHPSINKKL